MRSLHEIGLYYSYFVNKSIQSVSIFIALAGAMKIVFHIKTYVFSNHQTLKATQVRLYKFINNLYNY